MKKIISLIIKKNNIKGLEVIKKKNGFVASFIRDSQDFLSRYRRKTYKAIVSLDSPVFIKNILLKKDKVKSRRRIKELILRNPPFSLKDSLWDYFIFAGKLTLFVIKSKDTEKALSFLESLSIEPISLTSKVSSLYNYFLFNNPLGKRNFSLLHLASDSSGFLVFDKGRFFFSEVPFGYSSTSSEVLNTLTNELKRIKDYLQFKEGFSQESFSEISMCGKIENDFIDRLSQNLRAKVNVIKDTLKLHFKEEISEEFKEDLPILLGACFGIWDKKLLNINFIKEQGQKKIAQIYRGKFLNLLSWLGILAFIFLAGASFFLLNNIFINKKTLISQEKIVKEILPVYQHLNLKKENLLKVLNPLNKEFTEHKFLIEAINLISKSLKDLEVQDFSFLKQENLKINIVVKGSSYEEVSSFLKKLRDTGYFKKIQPVSSHSQTKGTKEFIYFKIRLLK